MVEDRFASYDAAYVIGALSARDRQEYEQHLRGCAECAHAVRELAGMPGLLSRLPADLVPQETEAEPPPSSLLTGLLAAVRRQRLRTRWTAVGASVVAAAACLVLVLFVALRPPATGQPPVSIPTATMSPVQSAPVWATVGLEEVAWGTKVKMHCMYERSAKYNKGGVYELVVVTEGGEVESIGSWTVRPGKDATLQAATSRAIGDISAVEIRTSEGKPLLRMKP